MVFEIFYPVFYSFGVLKFEIVNSTTNMFWQKTFTGILNLKRVNDGDEKVMF